MSKRIKIRLAVILFFTLLSIYLFAGAPPSVANMKQRIRLGLDLQGGVQLVLKVKTSDAIRAETDQTIESLRTQLQKAGITYKELTRTEDNQFTATGVDTTKNSDFQKLIADNHPEWDVSSKSGDTPNSYSLQLKQQQEVQYRQQSVEQAVSTISNRINQLGVTEPTIQRRGTTANSDEILIQFPGVKDPGRVRSIIQSTALLELKMVEGGGTYPSEQAALQQYGGQLPSDLQVLPSSEHSADGSTAFFLIHKSGGISGRDLKNAYVSRDENGRPAISFSLNADGAQKFGIITEQNIGKLLAIILDGRVQSAPVLKSRITDQGQITGSFTPEDAKDLALKLRSGALPASISIEQETTVGATLGTDSIVAGVTASGVALAAVIVFMLVYYKASGINATAAMLLNLIVLLGAMAYLGATMTLPGIAGVILTIGVGIDSNVLIFERIREELRSGKNAASAVTTSFGRVFITLVDTHLAALISAAFLFLFGTGPVKGFAVTLFIGLVSNMFTAVFVSRTLFELVLMRKERAEAISI